MKITYYGQSCFLLETSKRKLLFDPFISPNELANEVKVDQIECDFMLITHGHEDHVADAEVIARRTGAKIISNFEIVNWFASKGLENGHPMNHELST
jgi:L-ascorbate metabolism protein UlaG (beta-lactamase superfamily)